MYRSYVQTVYTVRYMYRSHVQHSTHCTVCTDPIVQHSTHCTACTDPCTKQYTLYSMYRSHVQHSTHCTACTDIMYNTVYTVQFINMSCPLMFMTIGCCASQKIVTSNAHNHTVSSNMIYSLVCPVKYSIHNICPL